MTTTYSRNPTTGQILFGPDGYPILGAATDNNLALLQFRIGYEGLGPGTSDDVNRSIFDSISYYERQTFWFNKIRYYSPIKDPTGKFGGPTTTTPYQALVTVPGKEFLSDADYAPIVSMAHISKILIEVGNNRYTLRERTTDWIDEASIATTYSDWPTDWCYEAGSIRLYPIPASAYPLIINATCRFAPLEQPGDSNPWTDEAGQLIRYAAKVRLMLDINRDKDQAQVLAMAEQREYQGLKGEDFRRTGGPGRIRASF